MLKNLKHSIILVLTIVMLLSVVLVSLAASKPVNIINTSTSHTQEVVGLKYQSWSGLGMGMFTAWNTSVMDGYLDTLLASGFNQLRIDIPDYQDTAWLEASKIGVVSAVAKGVKVIWGVSSNNRNNSAYTITAANWPTFRQAILDAAKWAQDNGVYEFQLGNEEEYHIDETTMTEAQLIANLKSVATDVQKIFTNGKVSYSCGRYPISNWISAGKGDIDILALNTYMGGTTFSDNWKTDITNMVNAFGTNGTYLTEFNLSSISLDSYSTDETVQAAALASMIEYIEASGITRAFYFCWNNSALGPMKSGGTYRELWDVLTTSDTTAPSITGLSDDTTPTDSKTWTWDADEPATFRYLIDDNPDSVPTGDYSDTKTTTQSGVEDGTYYIHVQAKDAAGNESEVVTVSAVLVSDILDTTAPSITGLSDDTTPTDSKTWTWDADEPATFRYLIDDNPDSVPTGDYSSTTTATQSGVEDGTYYIHVQAKDEAGNESEVVTVSAVLVSDILDTTAPSITGLSDDTTPTDSKTWTWDADEPATFRYLVDDNPDSVPIGDYSDTKTTTQSGVEDGTYYIHVQAKDAAGNESQVVTVSAVLVTAAPEETEQSQDTEDPEETEQSSNTTQTSSNTSSSGNKSSSGGETKQQYNDPVKAFTARLYQECLDRSPDEGGLNNWADQLKTGAKTGAKVVYGFVFSDEFMKRNVSNGEYITILYRVFFDREPDSGGYNNWVDHLNSGKSRKWVLARFVNSKEFKKLCAAYGIKPGSI